ncbi:MAG: FtsX-like permease family protein [Acidobacteria bacterium]|nr:MAG: FtsX-like permease family protein [Acidobacteriota bacterium]
MLKIMLRQLLHHPVRMLLSMIMISVALLLGLVIKGLSNGLMQEKIHRTEGIGADLMIQPPHSSYILGLGGNVMPDALAQKIAEVEGVQAATPTATNVSFTNRLETIFGIDLPSFNRVTGGFVYLEGGPFSGPYTALVDDVYTRTHNVHLGSTLNILDHRFTVSGVVEHGKGARVFVPLKTIQDLLAPGKCAVIFVKCAPRSLDGEVEKRLREFAGGALKDYQITRMSDLATLITPSSFLGLQQFLLVIVMFAGVINFLVIFLALYVQVLGQTRELGILRALGASRRYMLRLFLGEACLLCLLGGGLSLVLYFLTRTIVLSIYPALHFMLPVGSVLRVALIALASAVLGGAYPAYRASACEPIAALAYE